MAEIGLDGGKPVAALDRDGYRVELFPSRSHVRVRWAGRTVADTTAPLMVRETGYVPTWYIPKADIDQSILRDSDHRSYCPYKGEAHYWSLATDDALSENAVWHYPEPFPELAILKDYVAFFGDRVEAVEEVDHAGLDGQASSALATGVGVVFDWMLTDAWRLLGPRELTESFVRLLRAEDPDLLRFFVGIYVVHPMVRAMGYSWESGANEDVVSEFDAPHRSNPSEEWMRSPLRLLHEDGLPELRVDLTDAKAVEPFPLLQRLREEGGTDYLALPMPYANRVDTLAVTTKRTSGFDMGLVEDLRRTTPLLGRLYALHGLNRTAHTLLDTYIGPQAAERVFYGQVKRGDGEDIRAAIWFCDLRQFTQHSETLARVDLICLLNDYFSMITDAVRRNGGEVLKFIGDAVLAIFPIGIGSDVAAICRAAYRAALDARIAVDAFNLSRQIEGADPIDFGISLHVGDVLYGNIGAPDRLDFTVIGPAVNLVTRIEALCAMLNEPILLSGAFIEAAGIPARALGPYRMKGIAEPQKVYVAEAARLLGEDPVAVQQPDGAVGTATAKG